jgi:hypothetical protein
MDEQEPENLPDASQDGHTRRDFVKTAGVATASTALQPVAVVTEVVVGEAGAVAAGAVAAAVGFDWVKWATECLCRGGHIEYRGEKLLRGLYQNDLATSTDPVFSNMAADIAKGRSSSIASEMAQGIKDMMEGAIARDQSAMQVWNEAQKPGMLHAVWKQFQGMESKDYAVVYARAAKEITAMFKNLPDTSSSLGVLNLADYSPLWGRIVTAHLERQDPFLETNVTRNNVWKALKELQSLLYKECVGLRMDPDAAKKTVGDVCDNCGKR